MVRSQQKALFAHDASLAALSFPVAAWLWLGEAAFDLSPTWAVFHAMTFSLCATAVFAAMGLHLQRLRDLSAEALLTVAGAVVVAGLVYLPIVVVRFDDLPRSILLVQLPVLLAMLAAPRVVYRILSAGPLARAPARSA